MAVLRRGQDSGNLLWFAQRQQLAHRLEHGCIALFCRFHNICQNNGLWLSSKKKIFSRMRVQNQQHLAIV